MPAFRAHASTSQSISSGGTQLNFATTVFDYDGGMGTTIFTLPTSWENKRVKFSAGIRITSSLNVSAQLQIQYSINSGSTWDSLSEINLQDTLLAWNLSSPVDTYAVSGTQFRVMAYGVNSTTTASGLGTVFFSGALVDEIPEQGHFIDVGITSNRNVNSAAFVQTDLDLTRFDTLGAHNTATGVIEIPHDIPTYLAEITGTHACAFFTYFGTYIQQDRGALGFGGTNLLNTQNIVGDNAGAYCAASFVEVQGGDQFRMATYNIGGNTINANDRTHLSMRLWRNELPFNIYAHFDLSLDDYTTSGSDITVIPDQSGNGRDLDVTVSSAWPQDGRTLGGKSVADFVGGNDVISGDSFAAFANTDQPFTLAYVLDADDATNFQHMCGFHTSGGDEYQSFAIDNTPLEWAVLKRDTGASTFTANSGFTPTTGAHVIIFQCFGTTISAWIDGEKIFQNQTYDEGAMTGVTRFGMGNVVFNGAALAGFDGGFAEAIIYDRALTDGDCNYLTDYLATKWGVTNVRKDGHRYWRLIGTVAGSFDGGALCEIEMYTEVGGANVAVEGTPLAGSEAFSGTAVQAFDGNKTTSHWAGASGAVAANTSWVQYDYGPTFFPDITQIEITARDGPDADQVWDEWDLEYSDDGSSWTVAQSFVDVTAWSVNESRKYAV